MNLRAYLCVVIIISFSECLAAPYKKREIYITKKMHSPGKHPAITVWIHGTRLFSKPLAHVFPSFFYCKQGLHPAVSLDKKFQLRHIAETLSAVGGNRFSLENFYIYGWPGTLSRSVRMHEAKHLLDDLEAKIIAYKERFGQEPEVIFIAHSHGGNLALEVARMRSAESALKSAQLILLACPVQQMTAHLTEDHLWNRIYSLYSTLDKIQILDPQGLYRWVLNSKDKPEHRVLFSERQFAWQRNLRQVQLKLYGRGLMHVEFLLDKFISLLPVILDEIDLWYDEDPSPEPRLLSIKKAV